MNERSADTDLQVWIDEKGMQYDRHYLVVRCSYSSNVITSVGIGSVGVG